MYNDIIMELFRGVRTHTGSIMGKKSMHLGLSHFQSRYKLKFSADKVDIVIAQVMDDLDKEINIYLMRARE